MRSQQIEKGLSARKELLVQRPDAVLLPESERTFLRRLEHVVSVIADEFIRHAFENLFRLGRKVRRRQRHYGF